MLFTPGRGVDVRFRKYDGSPHWEHGAVYVGQDEFGHWVGVAEGAPMARPGRSVNLGAPSVMCFAYEDWWVIAANHPVNEPEKRPRYYIDMTSVPAWSEPSGADGPLQVDMIDLDLDVVRRVDGSTLVDDEDEFAEHQRTFGYPTHVIEATEDSARRVHEQVADPMDEPYATVCDAWMERFFALAAASA